MSYRNLIDVGLNVDTSELQETLGRIDQNIEVLTDRVKSIEDGGYPVDEDKVHDLIATYVSDEGIITESDIDGKLREHVSSVDLDSLIGDYLSDNDYPSNDDVDQKVSDAIENGDFVNPAQMDEKIEEALENSDLATRVSDLQAQVDRLVLDMAHQSERNDTAMTFFDLIKQAFALLQRGG